MKTCEACTRVFHEAEEGSGQNFFLVSVWCRDIDWRHVIVAVHGGWHLVDHCWCAKLARQTTTQNSGQHIYHQNLFRHQWPRFELSILFQTLHNRK